MGRDVVSGRPGELPLLRAGTEVTEDYRNALIAAGVHAVYVEDDMSAGVEVREPVSARTRQEATAAIGRAFQAATQFEFGGKDALPPQALQELQGVAALIAADVAAAGDAALAFNDLAAADAYTVQHSIDVTALGLLLAQRLFTQLGWIDHRGRRTFGRIEEKLTRLGLGLLLHDVGKLAIPLTVLNKPGRLTDEEMELMRGHPVVGVDMLRSNLISPLVKAVVRSHHERWDGSGYPDRRRSDDIHQFARIAAVADVYDAITSERPYQRAGPAHRAVRVIVEGSGSAFDPEVVSIFRTLVAPYPPGTEVALSDGRRGIVVDAPRAAIDRPLVRVALDSDGRSIDPLEIDLREHPQLQVGPLPAEEREPTPAG